MELVKWHLKRDYKRELTINQQGKIIVLTIVCHMLLKLVLIYIQAGVKIVQTFIIFSKIFLHK